MVKKFLDRLRRKLTGKSAPKPAAAEATPHRSKPRVAEIHVDSAPPASDPRRRPSRSRGQGRRRDAAAPESSAAAVVRPPVHHKVWTRDQLTVPPEEGRTRFSDLDLPDEILHGISDLGFLYCTPVQAEILPHTLQGRNAAGQAQTGTGKTAAFLLTILARMMASDRSRSGEPPHKHPRALILAPTRELVIQIMKDAEGLQVFTPYKTLALYGGLDYEKQRRTLEDSRVDLIAATPGRLLDFVSQRFVSLANVEILVIDEADRMLDMGFIPDVRRIIRHLPAKEQRQSLMFSATLSDDVMRLSRQWVPDPVMIEIDPEQVAVDTVEQVVYVVKSDQKFTLLYNLLKKKGMTKVLVFANRRDRTQRVADELERCGITCGLLSGAVEQKKRLSILEAFKTGKLDVLVATDVAGRGIHIKEISHVINFELPYEPDDYVHRIGRTGRAGAEGTAISFACEDESFIIPDIEKYIKRELRCTMPEDELLTPIPDGVRKARPARMDGDAPPRRDAGGSGRPRSGSSMGRGGARGGSRSGGAMRPGARRP